MHAKGSARFSVYYEYISDDHTSDDEKKTVKNSNPNNSNLKNSNLEISEDSLLNNTYHKYEPHVTKKPCFKPDINLGRRK